MSNFKTVSAFKKHLTLLCVLFTVVIPLTNNFGLSLVLSFITGDIMLVTAADILSYFIAALDTVNLFLVYGVLINSVVRFGFKGSKNLIILCIIRVIIIYSSYLAIGAIVTTNFAATLKGNLFYCVINSLIDVMLLVGAVVLISFLRSKYIDENNTDITVKGFLAFKNPLLSITLWVTALISAFLLSGCVINTVLDITAYGASDLNTTEIIYLVTPYIEWLFKTIVGYTVMWICEKWLGFQWKCLHNSGTK